MYIQIHVTCGSRSEAEKIAGTLVEKRLIACAQLAGPVTSIYRWEGKVESGEEWMCTMKTTAALYDEVETEVLELHSYETPEIIATKISTGSSDYLAWISEVTRTE